MTERVFEISYWRKDTLLWQTQSTGIDPWEAFAARQANDMESAADREATKLMIVEHSKPGEREEKNG